MEYSIAKKINPEIENLSFDENGNYTFYDKDFKEIKGVDQDDFKAQVKAEMDKIQYSRNRASEYPSIQNQLDMIYWDRKNDTKKWDEAIKAVKDKYPK